MTAELEVEFHLHHCVSRSREERQNLTLTEKNDPLIVKKDIRIVTKGVNKTFSTFRDFYRLKIGENLENCISEYQSITSISTLRARYFVISRIMQ